MAKGIFDNMGGQNAGSATKMGQTVKAGRIDRPKYRPVSRTEAAAPPKGVKGKDAALYSRPVNARAAALAKAATRAQNKAKGLPANAGMSKIERAMGSTKKMTIAKAQPRYQSPGGNSSGGYLKKITSDMEKR
jgi:hypothetical protein